MYIYIYLHVVDICGTNVRKYTIYGWYGKKLWICCKVIFVNFTIIVNYRGNRELGERFVEVFRTELGVPLKKIGKRYGHLLDPQMFGSDFRRRAKSLHFSEPSP